MSAAGELETGRCYVAVGTERFKKLPYVELLVSKATERYCQAGSSVGAKLFVSGASFYNIFSENLTDSTLIKEDC